MGGWMDYVEVEERKTKRVYDDNHMKANKQRFRRVF